VPDHRCREIVRTRPAYEQIDMELAIARYCDERDKAA
jgi:hypothetical protein